MNSCMLEGLDNLYVIALMCNRIYSDQQSRSIVYLVFYMRWMGDWGDEGNSLTRKMLLMCLHIY